MAILTSLQNKFLREFFKCSFNKDFFLTGGTALSAFYLKHRVSEDLDLFTLNQSIDFSAVNAEILRIIASLSGKIEERVSSPTFSRFIFKVDNDVVKVDIVKEVPIHFGEVIKVGDIFVDSLDNMAVGKLLALFSRADAKDFIDLYFLLKIDKKITFYKLFTLAKKKDPGLSEFYLADMLSRVTDLKLFPKMLRKFNKEDFIGFFENLSNSLYQKIKPYPKILNSSF